jgi:hypothetical protein
MMQLFADTWTDGKGVTWTFSQQNHWYNNTNHYYYTITSVANYGDEVIVPEIVYEAETPRTIGAIGDNLFKDNRTLRTVKN